MFFFNENKVNVTSKQLKWLIRSPWAQNPIEQSSSTLKYPNTKSMAIGNTILCFQMGETARDRFTDFHQTKYCCFWPWQQYNIRQHRWRKRALLSPAGRPTGQRWIYCENCERRILFCRSSNTTCVCICWIIVKGPNRSINLSGFQTHYHFGK